MHQDLVYVINDHYADSTGPRAPSLDEDCPPEASAQMPMHPLENALAHAAIFEQLGSTANYW